MRRVVGALVGCAVAAIVINTWIVEGLFVPLVVHGGSMTPAVLGAHRDWRCNDCGQTFACSLESLPPPGATAVCPHCGAANDPARGVDSPGNRMVVDRSALFWRPPRRWETVVVRSPENPEVLCVKRVVGLPGEVIEIAGGDVLVNGSVARKNLAAWRAMAVVVCNAQTTERWRGDIPSSWRIEDGWFVHHEAGGKSIDWLTYHHREYAVADTGRVPSILDGSPLDQNESRLLNEVDDVMLRCEIRADVAGVIHARASGRGDDFRVKLDVTSGEFELRHNGRPVRRVSADGELLKRISSGARMDFVVADHRVQFAIDGLLLLAHNYHPPDGEPGAGQQVLAIGAQGGKTRVRKLQVLRDVYYTADRRGASQFRLGGREYFLLGDNSSRSIDSRAWSLRGGISADLLLGPALVW